MRSTVPLAPCTPFVPARHNVVSWLETVLRKSALKRLVFNTPLFYLPLAGAKLYYRLWAWARGGSAWDAVADHPRYGEAWSRIARPWPMRRRHGERSRG